MAPPLIGITTSELRAPESSLTPAHDRRDLLLGLAYAASVEAAGAAAMIIPPFSPGHLVEAILDRVDGLVLPGGPDLDPVLYGQAPAPELGPINLELDRFELSVLAGALARDLPVLAICRGAELLNVFRGGSLVQHIEGHRQTEPGDVATERITIDPDSRLAAALGVTEADVNQFHHQAIDAIGENLRPVAWAGDGIVEAIEDAGRAFVIGVQWHAEGLIDAPEQRRLFTTFAAACAGTLAR